MALSFGSGNKGLLIVCDYVSQPDVDAGCLTDAGGLSVLERIFDNVLEGWTFDDVKIIWVDDRPVPQFEKPKSNKEFDLSCFVERVKVTGASSILALGSRTAKQLVNMTLTEARHQVHSLGDVPMIFSDSPRGLQDYNILLKDIVSAIEILNDPSHDPYEERVVDYTVIKDFHTLDIALQQCCDTGYFCMDFETDGGRWFDEDSFATLFGFSAQPGHTWIINIEHYTTAWTEEDIREIFDRLEKVIFSNINVIKIAHNLKYEAHWLMKYGVTDFRGEWHDTMLMSHTYDENTRNDLKTNVDRFLPAFSGYALKPTKGETWADIKFSTLAKYNAIDVHTTHMLYFFFTSKLLNDDADGKLYLAYRNIHMAAFWMFVRMEHRGALIDKDLIEESIEDAKRRLLRKERKLLEFPEVARFVRSVNEELVVEEIGKCEEKIRHHKQSVRNMQKLIQKYEDRIDDLRNGRQKMYTEVNFNSTPQLNEILYLHPAGFKFPLDVETGKPSTNKEYLRTLGHMFTDTLLAYRSIGKMINTYYVGIADKLDSNNRLHTRFNQHGTVTQRLSSADPNLQNIPTRTSQQDEDVIWAIKQVKKFFIVPEGYTAIQADYSQAELRLIANFSGDPVMRQVYLDGKDIHAMTASEIVGMSYEEFMQANRDFYKVNRNTAKSANFGLVYDISIPGYQAYIKNNTGGEISTQEAQRHKDSLFRKYPKLRLWHETYKAKVRKYGYVRTLFGSKRRLPEIDSHDGAERSKAERAAINSHIQGSGGQYTVFVMGLLEMVLPSSAVFFNTVHDSIFLYVRNDLVDYVIKLIIKYSEEIDLNKYFFISEDKVKVPMKMDFELSKKSWGDMEEIDSSVYR